MRILDSNNTFSSETFSDLSHDAQCPHKICSGSGIESKLPHAFIKRMRTDFETTAEYERFIACYSDAPIRAMRINTLKISKERFLDLCPWRTKQSELLNEGLILTENPEHIGTHPYHIAGLFYMQEPSAMSVVEAAEIAPGMRVLDLCAAPGGKSTQIAALMAGRGLLCCNEPIPSRAQILSRNIERMGVRNAVVLSAMPNALAPRFPAFFDRILVDAPCSGEGMFRRQPEILAQAAKMLRPGGTMVYSTCTFNNTENEGVLRRFLALHPEFSLVPFALPGLPEAKDGYLHLYPHEMRGEGHFVSRLKKADGADKADAPVQAAPQRKAPARAAAKGKAPAPIALPDVFSDAFTPNRLYAAGDALWMLPEQISIERLSGLRVLRTGLLLAHAEGKRSEPDHALAMALRPEEAAQTASLTQTQALAYQAGETLSLGDLAGGYTLLCCEGVSLGWGKQAGGLMKNHYPKGLRRR